VPIIVNDVRKLTTEVICGQGPAPAKPTISEKLVSRLKTKMACAEALASERIEVPDLTVHGRPLKDKVNRYVEDTIGDLFDHPDRA
jgi:hypothetical protein